MLVPVLVKADHDKSADASYDGFNHLISVTIVPMMVTLMMMIETIPIIFLVVFDNVFDDDDGGDDDGDDVAYFASGVDFTT